MTVLADALARRLRRLPPGTDALRWLDGELDDVTVDLFGDVAVLSLYRAFPEAEERRLAEALRAVRPLRAVYLKRRPKEARRAANEQSDVVAPRLPLVGAAVEPFTVTELGARFEIRPDNGLSVGLYLDSRDARGWVGANARGRAVLNLFAYTCGFAVAAGRGGAVRTVNVDVSRRVLDWGARNLELNGLPADRRDLLAGDAFGWLARLARKDERFGLVVLDPPGFSTSARGRFSAARDYHRLVSAAAAVMAPGGRLLAMCNVEAMSPVAFERQVERGLGPRAHRVLERFGASPVDFRASALKCLALELS